jgi:shikimate dehydrogenase
MIEQYSQAEGYEIRGDFFCEEPNFTTLRNKTDKILIYTERILENTDISKAATHYTEALSAGFDFVDLDNEEIVRFPENILSIDPDKLILSVHVFESQVLSLEKYEKFISLPGKIKKIAVYFDDVWKSFLFISDFKDHLSEKILTVMGECGEWTRTCSPICGSKWSYFAIPGQATASGQLTLEDWEIHYRHNCTEHSALYGILGNPVNTSLSPLLHNAFFLQHNIQAIYTRFPCSDIEEFFQHCPLELQGLSVTMPFKSNILPWVTRLEGDAAETGIINTLKREKDHWIGYNTDGTGVLAALDQNYPQWRDKNHIYIFGAGGFATACAYALKDMSEKITIINRTPHKAVRLASLIGASSDSFSNISQFKDAVIIQATPAGMGNSKENLLQEKQFHSDCVFLESIYHPLETPAFKHARAAGATCISGLELLYYQGLEQQKIWFDGLHLTDSSIKSELYQFCTPSEDKE